MRKHVALSTTLLAVLAAMPLHAAGELWTEDAAAAMEQAAKEGKDLLIDFTGSDWCGWCKKLDKEVFAEEAFTTAAPQHFVLLKLDFPRARQLSEAVKKQNAEWQQKLGVSGYPTIILADAAGKPYAKTGYRPGGAQKYLEHLDALRPRRAKRDEAFAKAEAAQGVDKAKALDAAIGVVGIELAAHAYGELFEEIIKLDPDDAAGLKSKYEAVLAKGEIDAALQGRKFDEALKLCDAALAKFGSTGESAQEFLFSKSLVYYNKKDNENAKKTLEAAVAAAPDTARATQIKGILERVFKTKSEASKK